MFSVQISISRLSLARRMGRLQFPRSNVNRSETCYRNYISCYLCAVPEITCVRNVRPAQTSRARLPDGAAYILLRTGPPTLTGYHEENFPCCKLRTLRGTSPSEWFSFYFFGSAFQNNVFRGQSFGWDSLHVNKCNK